MFFILALLKWIMVFGLLAGGGLFLLKGTSVEIPLVKYKGIEAYGVPAGIAMLAAGIALAYFWRITRRTVIETTETSSSDGTKKIRREESDIRTFKRPGF